MGKPIDVRGLEGKVVFDDFEDVYVMRADGTEIRPVARRAGSEFDGALVPDGSTVAFTSERDDCL